MSCNHIVVKIVTYADILLSLAHLSLFIILLCVFSQEKQSYTILLILTDGTINDLEATKVSLFKEACCFLISI